MLHCFLNFKTSRLGKNISGILFLAKTVKTTGVTEIHFTVNKIHFNSNSLYDLANWIQVPLKTISWYGPKLHPP